MSASCVARPRRGLVFVPIRGAVGKGGLVGSVRRSAVVMVSLEDFPRELNGDRRHEVTEHRRALLSSRPRRNESACKRVQRQETPRTSPTVVDPTDAYVASGPASLPRLLDSR